MHVVFYIQCNHINVKKQTDKLVHTLCLRHTSCSRIVFLCQVIGCFHGYWASRKLCLLRI